MHSARTKISRRLKLALLCSAGCLLSCGDDIPKAFLIEDLRILNIKTEPPEVPIFVAPGEEGLQLRPGMLPMPDLKPIEVTVLAAHPDLDATLQFDWIRCLPGLGSIPCEANDRVRLAETPSETLRFSPVQLLLQELTEQGEQADLAGAFNADPRDLLSGLIANVNVEIKVSQAKQAVDTPLLEGKKRIVLFEPRLVAQTIIAARSIDPSQIPQIEGIELPNLVPKPVSLRFRLSLNTWNKESPIPIRSLIGSRLVF